MEQHPHTILGWLNHHWAVISLVWFPAFLGYLNASAAFCNVMGWTKFADELGKLERALKAFVDNVKSQNQGDQNVQKNSDPISSDPVVPGGPSSNNK